MILPPVGPDMSGTESSRHVSRQPKRALVHRYRKWFTWQSLRAPDNCLVHDQTVTRQTTPPLFIGRVWLGLSGEKKAKALMAAGRSRPGSSKPFRGRRRRDMRPTCETCRYWRTVHREAEAGQCRRRPPALVKFEGADPETSWPRTDVDDWCGDHEPKPQEDR